MAWNTGDDYNKSGLIGDYTLIDGLYYYVVDKYCNDVDLSYIGFVDTIQNITFNPFLNSMDFDGKEGKLNSLLDFINEIDKRLLEDKNG